MKRRSFLLSNLAGLFAPKWTAAKERHINAGVDVGGFNDSGAFSIHEVEYEPWSAVCDYQTGDTVWFSGEGYAARADAFIAALPKFVQEVNNRSGVLAAK